MKDIEENFDGIVYIGDGSNWIPETDADRARFWRRLAFVISTRNQRENLFNLTPKEIDELFFEKYERVKKGDEWDRPLVGFDKLL